MLSVAIKIDRPKSVPQLSWYWGRFIFSRPIQFNTYVFFCQVFLKYTLDRSISNFQINTKLNLYTNGQKKEYRAVYNISL